MGIPVEVHISVERCQFYFKEKKRAFEYCIHNIHYCYNTEVNSDRVGVFLYLGLYLESQLL